MHCPAALPEALCGPLYAQLRQMQANQFSPAGVGRSRDFTHIESVRSDAIAWIDGETAAGRAWLAWAARLQRALNRALLLGLFSFESHFAHYRPGDRYRRHVDAFRGEANRVLSVVLYLNPQWQAGDGGELMLYPESGNPAKLAVAPMWATLVAFLSEEFPHEVLPARRDRYSIAGWYRVNTSTAGRVDPPR